MRAGEGVGLERTETSTKKENKLKLYLSDLSDEMFCSSYLSLRNVYLIIHQTDIETLRINLGRLLKISKFSMPAV